MVFSWKPEGEGGFIEYYWQWVQRTSLPWCITCMCLPHFDGSMTLLWSTPLRWVYRTSMVYTTSMGLLYLYLSTLLLPVRFCFARIGNLRMKTHLHLYPHIDCSTAEHENCFSFGSIKLCGCGVWIFSLSNINADACIYHAATDLFPTQLIYWVRNTFRRCYNAAKEWSACSLGQTMYKLGWQQSHSRKVAMYRW